MPKRHLRRWWLEDPGRLGTAGDELRPRHDGKPAIATAVPSRAASWAAGRWSPQDSGWRALEWSTPAVTPVRSRSRLATWCASRRPCIWKSWARRRSWSPCEKHPGMQMISFGPHIVDVPSPNERLKISSVEPFWTFLTGLLEVL